METKIIENENVEQEAIAKSNRGRKPKTVETEIEKTVEPIEIAETKAAPKTSNEVEKLKLENEKKSKELDELNDKFTILQKQLELLLKAQVSSPISKTTTDSTKEMVTIGCRAFAPCPLCTNDMRIDYTFNCGEERELELDEVKELMKDSGIRKNRNLFANGIFYFTDKKYYDMFKIKKVTDLSLDNVVRILTKGTPNDTILEINNITNNLSNLNVLHTIIFEIAVLLQDKSNPLSNWKYENRVNLENYIGIKFDSIIASTGIFKYLGKR